MRQCPNCKSDNPDDARFCNYCGMRLPESKEEILYSDLDELEELADMIESTALCGLGKSAPKPVISTIHAFREEYEEHILKKHCKAGVCSNLRTYKIDLEKCKGCSKCARNCPVNAITGKIKTPFVIDNEKCIKCGTCKDNCAFGAIYTE